MLQIFSPKLLMLAGKSKEAGTPRYLSLVVPLKKVGDEAVHKELGDKMERAATTASNFEAEQDSGSGPRCQDTILGDVDAQTSTTEDGVRAITATIDGGDKIITEASIRRHLKLQDSEGLTSLPNEIFFKQLTRMGVVIPLFDTMLVQPQDEAPSTSPSRIPSSPSLSSNHTTYSTPTTPPSIQTTHEAEETATMPYDSPLPGGHTPGSDEGRLKHNELMELVTKLSDRVVAMEEDLKQTKKAYSTSFTKLVLKVKKLEQQVRSGKARRRARIDNGTHGFQEDVELRIRIIRRSGIKGNGQRKGHYAIEPDLQRTQEEGSSTNKCRWVLAEGSRGGTSKPIFVLGRYHALQNRPYSVAEVWNELGMYLKNQEDTNKGKGTEKKSGGTKKKTLAKKRASEKQGEEFAMDFESLATKFPIVDWKTYVLAENFMYYQIFCQIEVPRITSVSLPDEEDEVWKNQHEYHLISWRLFDSCGIHILLMNNGIAIHLMIGKKYPLNQEMLSRMLSKRLQVRKDVETRKRVRALPVALSCIKVSHQNQASSDNFSSDEFQSVIIIHSLTGFFFDAPYTIFIGLSRKRCRSLAAFVPLATPIPGALSPVRTDLLPPRKRIRGAATASDYDDSIEGSYEAYTEPDIDSDFQADIDADIAAAKTAAALEVGIGIEANVGVEVGIRIKREDEVEEEAKSGDRGTIDIGVNKVSDIKSAQKEQGRRMLAASERVEADSRAFIFCDVERCLLLIVLNDTVKSRVEHGDVNANNNGNDNGDGGRNGNGNGLGGENGNGNPNINVGGLMPVARECTYQD
ncbi:hypothetical protein Tco_1056985 [Tanacetum coccineum]|uniref:Uncharacterized protein n=1 Tax=Tanacetum coccineum TaxID=301880 RepID=A0ABQ5H677_9ASTR